MSENQLPKRATLEQAKELLRSKFHEGTECPCCSQYVKMYKRTITSSMAYALILIYRYFETKPTEEYVHLTNYLNTLNIPGAVRNTGDISKLRYWGLIEEKPEQREDGSKRAGYWKITEFGRQFVRGEVGVKSHVKIYNSKSLGLVGEPIDIYQALTTKFDYKTLMNA